MLYPVLYKNNEVHRNEIVSSIWFINKENWYSHLWDFFLYYYGWISDIQRSLKKQKKILLTDISKHLLYFGIKHTVLKTYFNSLKSRSSNSNDSRKLFT